MKLITIAVSDAEHKRIKVDAAQKGVTIKTYLLNGNFITVASDAQKVIRKIKNSLPGSGAPTIPLKDNKDTCPHGFSRSLRMCKKGCK